MLRKYLFSDLNRERNNVENLKAAKSAKRSANGVLSRALDFRKQNMEELQFNGYLGQYL